jgi:hypothetical protein
LLSSAVLTLNRDACESVMFFFTLAVDGSFGSS